MPKYLDGAGLSHFWESIKPKLVTQSGSGTVVSSDDAANLPPLSLTVHGKSVQDGTPTPSAPVEIRSVEGRNLLPSNYKSGSQTYQGLTWIINDDGTLTCSGTATASGYYVLYGGYANSAPPPEWMVEGRTYGFGAGATASGTSDHGMMMVYFYKGTGTMLAANQRTSTSFTVPSGATAFGVFIRFESGKALNFTFAPRITADGYAPYTPYGSLGLCAAPKLLDFTNRMTANATVTPSSNGLTVNASSASQYSYAYMKSQPTVGTRYILTSTETSGTYPHVMLAFNDEDNASSLLAPIGMSGTGRLSVSSVCPSGANYMQSYFYARNASSGSATDYGTYEGVTLVEDSPTVPIDLQGYEVCTGDTLSIDSEGNVTLVKKMMSVTYDGSDPSTFYYDSGLTRFNTSNGFTPAAAQADTSHELAMCNRLSLLQQAGTAGNVDGFTIINNLLYISMSVSHPEITDVNALATWLQSNPLTVLYTLTEPQTISLGKIDLPSLPSPTFSMHVEALVTPTLDAEWLTEGIGKAVETVSARIAALEADVTELQGQVPEREVLYDTSTWTVIRYGRTVMVQVHGATATPSTSTALITGVLADCKPAYNCSATVLTSSGSSTQAARMAVYADTGNVYIVPAGYSSSASWYGTLTYIY